MQYRHKVTGVIIEAEQNYGGQINNPESLFYPHRAGVAEAPKWNHCPKCKKAIHEHFFFTSYATPIYVCLGDYLCLLDSEYWVKSEEAFLAIYEPYTPNEDDCHPDISKKPRPDPTHDTVYTEIMEAISRASADANITNLHVTINVPPEEKDEIQHVVCTKLSEADIAKQLHDMYHAGKDPSINIDEAINRYLPKNTHPLKNPDSSHYAMWHDGLSGEAVEAIDLMEQMATKEELLTWAKLTVLKYRLRIGKKDDIAKEMKKIETYEAYIVYLEREINLESKFNPLKLGANN